ncbi:MAG: cbb3-type cytochrome c oxidase subunit I [Methylocystaceae bacterium]|nr:cbb3-type cytochrome c oxidase subunit I [Methylocystaceae bacterium]
MTLKGECRSWTILAISALAIAGVFALLLVLSRTPIVQDLLPWPWKSFFHKGLVAHVVFSFVVWFLATLGALWCYRLSQLKNKSVLGSVPIVLAVIGCIGLILPALLDLGTAELNNYVPVMDHWIYYTGLVCLFASLGLIAVRQLFSYEEFDGYKACAILYLLALSCFALAFYYLPDDLARPSYNERLFWGGGHILQFVNTGLLFLTWMLVAKESVITSLYSQVAFGLLVVFAIPGVLIYPLFDVTGQVARDFYTAMLLYGLPLPSFILSIGMASFLLSKRSQNLDPLSRLALWLSFLTYNLGGFYGLMLDGTDTRVPAHYHAVIGGINLSFMIFYHRILLPFLQIGFKEGRLLKAQYWLYGLGQIMHASGMFLAGSQGVPRKTAGQAQSLDNIEKVLSMGLMGVGGLIAVIGGVLFVIMTLRWIIKARGLHEKTA